MRNYAFCRLSWRSKTQGLQQRQPVAARFVERGVLIVDNEKEVQWVFGAEQFHQLKGLEVLNIGQCLDYSNPLFRSPL